MSARPEILTAIRVHKRQSDKGIPFDPSPVCRAVKRALEYSTSVILAVSLAEKDLAALLTDLPPETIVQTEEGAVDRALVHVLPFTSATYGRFVPALNAIVAFAHAREFRFVLFQSVEVDIGVEQANKIVGLHQDDVLVVGKAFDAHEFCQSNSGQPNPVLLTGRTCPWNTFAMWDVGKLARTGFLLNSETNTPPHASAIEEAPTIALHQRLFPGRSRALLVQFEPVETNDDGWGTQWTDPARIEWHARKLASKDTSAASHIANIGLVGSMTTVEHIRMS
ncbi:cation diffusion facilitator family transporter [Ceratobasidium sp. AG-Ba]|nr:cation diffusion facilitator family transporter [Ceratobasidium sp. AG-Ba]